MNFLCNIPEVWLTSCQTHRHVLRTVRGQRRAFWHFVAHNGHRTRQALFMLRSARLSGRGAKSEEAPSAAERRPRMQHNEILNGATSWNSLLTAVVPSWWLDAQQHDAIFGALRSALERGAAAEGPTFESVTLQTVKTEKVQTYFSVPVSIVSVRRKSKQVVTSQPIRRGQNIMLQVTHRSLTCVIMDLLALELDDNGSGGSNQEDRQQDPPEMFVWRINNDVIDPTLVC